MLFETMDIAWPSLRSPESSIIKPDSRQSVLTKIRGKVSPVTDMRIQPMEHKNYAERLLF